jgi:hypothetical protein
VKSAPEARLTALAAVRITWITAIVVCALAILTGWFSGGEGGNPSRHLPGFAFADGGEAAKLLPDSTVLDRAAEVVGEPQMKARRAKAEARQQSGIQSAGEQASGDSDESRSRNRAPNRSGSQPEDVGARAPADTNGPSSPQGPSLSQPPRLPEAPSVDLPDPLPDPPLLGPPDPPQGPSGDPGPPQSPSGNPGGNPDSSQLPIRIEVSATVETSDVSETVETPVDVSASVELP